MNSLLNEEVNKMRSMMGLSENTINEDYEYEKSEIEKASGDKVVQREFDDYDRPLFWSLNDDNVNYVIGDGENGKVIIKYNAETGQSDVIGDIQYEGEGPEMNEEPEDMEMIGLSMAAMSHLSDLQEAAPELAGKINFVKALIMKMDNKDKISSEELDALYAKYAQ